MGIRETVADALFDALVATNLFTSKTRRNRSPTSFGPDQCPALILRNSSDVYRNPSPNEPIKTFNFAALLYFDAGNNQNTIPDQQINNLLDELDVNFFVPDNAAEQRFTLGGLVFSCEIDGKIIRAPGDVTGKSLAIVPIKIVLP